MASKKPAATAATKNPARVAAGKAGAPIAQATRSKVEPAPKAIAAAIKMDAPAKEVDKLIVSIKGRGAKLDSDIHSAAMACLFHADKHGDVTLMGRLLLALPKSTRRNALAQWAVKFGKFIPNEDKTTMAVMPLAFDKGAKTDFDGAQAQPFWDFKNVSEGTTQWMFDNFIGGVMKTLATRAAGTGPEAQRCKAAWDALNGVTEALAIPANGKPTVLPEGVTEDRRAGSRPVDKAAPPVAASLAATTPVRH